jgi:hypothetical protein
MLHIKLHDRRDIGPGDPMGRSWVGFDPTLSDDELFAQNRGRWVLGRRADREEYALFSYTGDHTVKFVAQIKGYAPTGNKRAICGHVLAPDHPVAQHWVGKPAPDNHRNPATYVVDADGGTNTCACGCGEAIPPSRVFAPGHDQKAVHERITRRWGSTLGFIRWFDEAYPDR